MCDPQISLSKSMDGPAKFVHLDGPKFVKTDLFFSVILDLYILYSDMLACQK
jgi:hypothetical protein